MKKLKQLFEEINYATWKKKNVTYRGIKNSNPNMENGVYGSLGKGLYSVPPSNKSMAKTYGELYFLVNAIPKNPKIFTNLNDWEIFFYNNLIAKFSSDKNYPDKREFEKQTTIEDEMIKLGYDGIIIKGREIVNFKPKDVKYFKTEAGLKQYFEMEILK